MRANSAAPSLDCTVGLTERCARVGQEFSQLVVRVADAQAKSSAPAGTANGTASKAKAGKVVFGATGNRLLDKQQATNSAKPPAPNAEVSIDKAV